MPRGPPARFVVTSGEDLSEGFEHGGPGVCLGDGQTETQEVPSQGGRGDALLRCLPSYLTNLVQQMCRIGATPFPGMEPVLYDTVLLGQMTYSFTILPKPSYYTATTI